MWYAVLATNETPLFGTPIVGTMILPTMTGTPIVPPNLKRLGKVHERRADVILEILAYWRAELSAEGVSGR